jgi:hypothetical protein
VKEYQKSISRILERYNVLFSEFWDIGEPSFSTNIETAAICWDEKGSKIDFLFNPDFFNSLSNYQRAFVVAHEILHVVLKHGKRLDGVLEDKKKMKLANIATDVVVNEFLLRKFGFQKMFLGDLYDILILEENTFGKRSTSLSSFEEYYALLVKQQGQMPPGLSTLDDHEKVFNLGGNGGEGESLGSNNDTSLPEVMVDAIIEQAVGKMQEYALHDLKRSLGEEINQGGKQAGSLAGTIEINIKKFKKIKKKKWIKLVKQWTKKKIKESVGESWVWPNRRIPIMNNSFFLPSEYIKEHKEKDKIDVWLFMDTSGSCAGYAERFFRAAECIPPEYFNVRLFCFDTRTFETSLKSRELYGFGGTRFDIIETKIQKIMKDEKRKKYPDSVWILTDGWGNYVKPQHPEKWKWFMTEMYKYYIPAESEVYKLSDFE